MIQSSASLKWVISSIAAALVFGIPARAGQDGRGMESRLTLGYSNFLDEGPLHHFVAGGSVRLYLTRRFGFEPELVYMYRSSADKDWVFVPNLTWDFRDPGRRVVPYLIGGPGILHHREGTGGGPFSSNTGTLGIGLGAKIFLLEHLFVSPEFRLGWEPIYRITGSIGYSFRKR